MRIYIINASNWNENVLVRRMNENKTINITIDGTSRDLRKFWYQYRVRMSFRKTLAKYMKTID